MTHEEAVRQSLHDGDPAGALARVQEQVRLHPADPAARLLLFQLLCVLGRWERALNQLTVAASLAPGALGIAQIYREAIQCERTRTQVFAGDVAPTLFGDAEDWMALLVESTRLTGRGEHTAAQQLRAEAFAQAPGSGGQVDGKPFDWIADADPRLGPVLEAIIDGRYVWIPFARMTQIAIAPPADLRDLVWASARLQFADGSESPALLPTRYPWSELAVDPALALARRTEWREVSPGIFHGVGQRMLTTDVDELPMLDIRAIALTPDRSRPVGSPVAHD